MGHAKIKRFCAVAAGALFASTLAIHIPTSSDRYLSFDSEVQARSSGGRSGGGSFRSSPSRSSGSSSSPSRSSGSSSPSYQQRDRYYGGPNIVPVPVPVGPGVYGDSYRNDPNRSGNGSNPNQAQDDGSWIVGLIILAIFAGVFLLIAYIVFRTIRRSMVAGGVGELDNHKVTISKIQVALLAEAREIQSDLTSLSMEIDTDTPAGLLQLLQESALALLRMPENWSHVLASSQTVNSREEAETIFSRSSIAERSKFSVETLTNVGGRATKRDDFKPDPNEDPAAYIVVTLLVGTAHDKPLFAEIRTEQALKETLEKLASVPPEYLMVFELLWSPQDATDSLTYDELLTEYTDMVQI